MSRTKQILTGAVLGAIAFTGATHAATLTVPPVVVAYYANQTDLGTGTTSPVPG